MRNTLKLAAVVTGVLAGGLVAAVNPDPSVQAAAVGPAGAASQPAGVTVLRMARQWDDPAKDAGGTIWRYHETWQTDVARTPDPSTNPGQAGQLVRVAPYIWRKPAPGGDAKKGPFELVTTTNVIGSDFPPPGWEKPDFDDSRWSRQPGPIPGAYRSVALINLRGRFEVADPTKVKGLNLEVAFQGGAVAYLNGVEIGRAGLPSGKITGETLADDYPRETDQSDFKGWWGLLPQYDPWWKDGAIYTKEDAGARLGHALGTAPQETKAMIEGRYLQRYRALATSIPAGLLRPGVNVLALEVHRAPAHPVMFTAPDDVGERLHNLGWNRCFVGNVALKADGAAGAAVPNVARPGRLQVWNASTWSALTPAYFGDPCEGLRPIRLVGLRNGIYSEQLVISSPAALKNLKATVSDLKTAGAGVLPASAVEIGYVQWDPSRSGAQFDPIEPAAPPEIPGEVPAYRIGVGVTYPGHKVAFQPIWVAVRIPRAAPAGQYAGKLTVSVDGEPPIDIPLQVRVAGEWALPDPPEFTTLMGVVESPDSVALKYNVKMWSEAHWALLDKVFALTAEVGAGDLYIPLLAKTALGNEESMVRWLKQPDGSYKYDYSLVERYLDTAAKHLKKNLKLVFWIHSFPDFHGGLDMKYAWAGIVRDGHGDWPMPYTELDAATGQTKEMQAPQWGSPEARTFWKPVIEGIQGILAKRGLEKGMLFGSSTDLYLNEKCRADCLALAPDVKWYFRTHHLYIGGDTKKVGYFNWGGWSEGGADVLAVNWEPDETDAGCYRWRSPAWKTAVPTTTGAWSMHPRAVPAIFRISAESILLFKDKGWGNHPTVVHGMGCIGADYWSVKTEQPKRHNPYGYYYDLLEYYTAQASMDPNMGTWALLGAGKNGPVPSCHLRLVQEALQDMEARIFVQNALLDQKDKLGPDLARRCKQVCDERTRQLHYYSAYTPRGYQRPFRGILDEAWYARNTETLYELAGEVAKALGN